MNEVFYCLSITVAAITAVLLYSVSWPIVALVWAVLCGMILFDDLDSLAHHIRTQRPSVLSMRKHEEGSITFAPIENRIAAHFADQITPKMTIEQIEELVTDHESHQGIHARTNKIER